MRLMTLVIAPVAFAVGMRASSPAIPPSTASTIDHIPATALNAALDSTMRSGAKGVQFRLAADRNAQYLMNRRTSPSEVELHCEWDDILVVRAGSGVVSHSSRVQKPVKYTWGEWRAARLVTPDEVMVMPGDVVRIPAGAAHQVRPLGDVPLVYLVVKVRSAMEGMCGSLEKAARGPAGR